MSIIGRESDIEESEEYNRELPYNPDMDITEPEPIEADTPIELQQFLIQPTAEKMFKFITKDMAITYLDDDDMQKIRMLCQIIVTLNSYGLKKVARDFNGDMASILVSARSRHGFERQMEQTNIGKSFSYYDEQEANARRGR